MLVVPGPPAGSMSGLGCWELAAAEAADPAVMGPGSTQSPHAAARGTLRSSLPGSHGTPLAARSQAPCPQGARGQPGEKGLSLRHVI